MTLGTHCYKRLVIRFPKCVLIKAMSCVIATEGKVMVLWNSVGEKEWK